jgi:hypothetical protein
MMSKKQSKKTKDELCELYSHALEDFKEFFKNKKKTLKAEKTQKKPEPEE